MSSYNCCISQKPPSPEGPPPRAIMLPSNAVAVKSWSTASRLSKPGDVTELRALFQSEGSDIENNQCQNVILKRTTSTLSVVKSKLRKHLSRESTLSRRRLRSTVGNSDEEIQRRKELRSIRNKRIKEELSSEGAYDDDAKTLSTVATESDLEQPWREAGSEGIELLKTFKFAQPHLFARKSLDACHVRKSSSLAVIQRRHSLAVLENLRVAMPMTDWAAHKDSLDFPMPPAPMLKPQILPSITDLATRRTSWRLSFASDQRATHLRALSHDYAGSPAAIGIGPLGNISSPLKWFRGQLASAAPSVTANLPRLDVLGYTLLQGSQFPEVDDCQGVDGSTEQRKVPVFLHEMQISRRLASRGLHGYSSSPQLSSWGSRSDYRGRSYNSQSSHYEATSRRMHHRSASDLAILDPKLSTCWGDLLRDHISSIDDCANPALKEPKSSGCLLTAHGEDASFPCINSHNLTVIQGLPVLDANPDATETTLPLGSGRLFKKEVPDIGHTSSPALEALSVLEREAEFAMTGTRFPKSMERSTQTSSVRSKFIEEFGKQHQISASTTPRRKASLSTFLQLPKLAKLVSRTYDGANPFELQIPRRQGFGFTFSSRSHSTGGTVSPGARSSGTNSPVKDSSPVQNQDADELWTEALISTQEEYKLHRAPPPSPTKSDSNDHHVRFSTAESASRYLKGKGRVGLKDLKNTNCSRLPVANRHSELEREFRGHAHTVEEERTKADEQVNELEAQDRQPRTEGAAMMQRPSAWRPKMPPESWARFPSHTREERTASAGLADDVSPKDFAMKNVEYGVVEWMKSDRKHHHHHHHHHREKEKHHSLPVRISKQIRTSLYKLRTLNATAKSDVIRGRHGSVSVGGKLEFPELEIIAGEITGGGLVEELQNETEEAMRRNERATRMVVFSEDGFNGEADVEWNMSIIEQDETSQMSIADPRFYDDCVTLPPEDDEIDEIRPSSSITVLPVGETVPSKLEGPNVRKETSQTWSGTDRGAREFTAGMTLRGSTLDFQVELEMMETLERDRAIRSAEEAWGNHGTQGYY